jgi:hypothetical protein
MRNPWQTVGSGNSASGSALLAAAFRVLFAGTAQAGPCTAQIDQLESQIHLAASNPAAGPTAPQTVNAQLHRQPTPGAVEHGEAKANADGEAALERARKADAQGDASGCLEALRQTRELYGFEVEVTRRAVQYASSV